MQTSILTIAGLLMTGFSFMANAQASESDKVARTSLEFELGAAQLKQNDLQSPNDATATRFDLARIVGTETTQSTARITLRLPTASGAEWLAVYAPITFKGSAPLGQTVGFQGASFAGAPETSVSYRFDTYRLSWRTPVYQNANTTIRLGLTGLVRDASIALSQPGVSASRSNIGLVPLLHASAEHRISDRLSLLGDVDALGSQQGHAIDFSLRAQLAIDRDWAVSAGYRVLDGGANNDTLYNFARVQSLTVGVRRSF
jgi:hypothetical protein